MTLVLDASVTLAWLYAGERSPPVLKVFEIVTSTGAIVPSIWRLEIGNGLQHGVRSRRITASFRDASLKDLGELNILTDPDTEIAAWGSAIELADRFRLTIYDACYLELAHRTELPLATLDKELRDAAARLRIPLLGT